MPVERMRMRPWLEEQINSCLIPGLKWVNREKRIFQIPWMHAARHGWDLEKDAPLFKNWAIHTGKKKREKEGKHKEQVEPRSSSTESMNGSVEDHEVVKVELKDEVKEEYITDCKEYLHPGSRSPGDDQLIIDDLPYVCQTIEVTTENEEQSVSSSHPYPLQISPVSSYGESDTDSVHSEEDSKGHLRGGLWGSRLASSVLRVPSCSLPSMATFVTAGKVTNFKVTSTRDPMPLISYNNSPWKRDMPAAQHTPSEQASSSQASAAETRASVIVKTSDISKSSVKTC
ncbi:interferon regulatory factor 2-like isoform X2 [Salvelinus fontinalis]|uniref:interferon regulatory factor 2-like isoform X2 n=1 Tax=Salvelinus fontinalis TaxID=8038 RepID=UPI0024858FFF|nr:interferon regulatory factor 2-like isoform X2 [Salvelinus fontinalis]